MPVPLQLMRYGLVGVGALLLDLGCFMLLRSSGVELAWAHIAARAVGAVAAYAGNYAWTFMHHSPQKNLPQSVVRYALWWLLATTLSTWFLPAAVALSPSEPVAKLVLELIWVALNFLAARLWVYR